MEQLPIAEEWLSNHKKLSKYDVVEHDEGGYLGVNEENLYKIMIEFAKLHVEAALKEASEKAKTIYIEPDGCATGDYYDVDKESILNSYPLDKIK
jgi:hypothetical protein